MRKEFLEALGKAGLELASATEAAQVRGWLPTGNYALNWAVGGRFAHGWPFGHVAEIYGDPSTGKTFIVARSIAAAQEAGAVTLLDDTEGAFNLKWAKEVLNIDGDRLFLTRSSTVKDHMEVIDGFLDAVRYAKETALMVLDSLALLTTTHELEVGLEKVSMTRAKEMRSMFRQVGTKINALDMVYLVTNHTIANIGNIFQRQTTPGGSGLKFQASVRIEMRSVRKLKIGDEVVGVLAHAHTSKNRLAAPFKDVYLTIPFFRSISPFSGLLPVLEHLGVIKIDGRKLLLGDRFAKGPGDRVAVGTFGSGLATGISPYKTDHLKQDGSAEELLDRYPLLLSEVDQWLDERDQERAHAD